MSPTQRTLAKLREDCYEIPLTKGYIALVDKDTPLEIMELLWCADVQRKFIYAVRRKDGRKQYLHRLITNAPAGVFVDHVNGDTLDNRMQNLRFCTRQQNARNQIGKGVTQYKGVTRYGQRWCARITHAGVSKHLGVFDLPEEAARAYNAAAIKHFGEFARINVIPD